MTHRFRLDELLASGTACRKRSGCATATGSRGGRAVTTCTRPRSSALCARRCSALEGALSWRREGDEGDERGGSVGEWWRDVGDPGWRTAAALDRPARRSSGRRGRGQTGPNVSGWRICCGSWNLRWGRSILGGSVYRGRRRGRQVGLSGMRGFRDGSLLRSSCFRQTFELEFGRRACAMVRQAGRAQMGYVATRCAARELLSSDRRGVVAGGQLVLWARAGRPGAKSVLTTDGDRCLLQGK